MLRSLGWHLNREISGLTGTDETTEIIVIFLGVLIVFLPVKGSVTVDKNVKLMFLKSYHVNYVSCYFYIYFFSGVHVVFCIFAVLIDWNQPNEVCNDSCATTYATAEKEVVAI